MDLIQKTIKAEINIDIGLNTKMVELKQLKKNTDTTLATKRQEKNEC